MTHWSISLYFGLQKIGKSCTIDKYAIHGWYGNNDIWVRFGCSVVLKDLSSKQHAKQMHDTNSTIQIWSRGWCGFGVNRCYILEKEWTESEIIIIHGILKYAFSMGGVRAFDLTEFLPMQEKTSQSEK